MNKEKITTATKITLSRIAILPIILFFYLSGTFINASFFVLYGRLIALILFVIAAATDWLDGYIARKHNQVTDMGKMLDPIADKVLTLAGFLLIATDIELVSSFRPSGSFLPMPIWFAVLALFIAFGRDIIINGLRFVAAEKGVKIAADKFGKAKSVAQYVAISLLMFYGFASVNNFFGINPVGTIVSIYEFTSLFALALATILTLVSAGNYLYQYRELYLGKREKKDWGEK